MSMKTQSAAADATTIHPDTTVGTVQLTVSDLERSRAFCERVLGLRATELDDGGLALGAAGGPLVELRGDSSAPRLDRQATGLYHLALLTTWSARRCTFPIPTATGSRSTAIARASTGGGSTIRWRWPPWPWTSETCSAN